MLSREQFCIILHINNSFEQRGFKVERAVLPEKPKALVIDDGPLCNIVAEALLAKTREGSNHAFDRRKG